MSDEERVPNKVCGNCGYPLRWAHGQSRCVTKGCEFYWQGQGGIETLTPAPPQPGGSGVTSGLIRKPPNV